MLNTISIGDIGEAAAIFQFSVVGCVVSKPLSNNARYDLIIEYQHKLYKVQVKTTECIKDNGTMEFAIKTTNYSKGSWSSNSYSTEDIDLFFLYCVENNWCGLYIIDNNEELQKSLSIRIVPPKNNQTKGIRLAENYCFETQFKLLSE